MDLDHTGLFTGSVDPEDILTPKDINVLRHHDRELAVSSIF